MLLFALSSFEVITNFYSLPMFLSFIFLSLCFFNGGKRSIYRDVPRSQHISVLYSHHIFSSLRAALSLLFHDIFGFITYAIVRRFTIFMNAPRCHLLLRHDIYECTAMPIF